MEGWDPAIAVAGLVVGIVVGMTGMGGLPLTSVAVRRTATVLVGGLMVGLTGSIRIGAVPGAWFGARLSSRSRGMLVRRALAVLMLASGLELLEATTRCVALLAGGVAVLGRVGWALVRVHQGEPGFVVPRWYEQSLRRGRIVPQILGG